MKYVFLFQKKKNGNMGAFYPYICREIKSLITKCKANEEGLYGVSNVNLFRSEIFFFFFEVFLPIFIYEQEVLYYWEKKKVALYWCVYTSKSCNNVDYLSTYSNPICFLELEGDGPSKRI